MAPLLTDFLMLSDEPVVLARGGRVLQLNGSAEALLGAGCAGKSVREVFGAEIAGVQAPHFLAGVSLLGQLRTVRVSRVEGLQLLFISREDKDLSVVNEASLAAMRGCLMNLSLSAEQGRQLAEAVQSAELERCFASITRQYHLLNRLIANSGIVYSMLQGELPATLSTVDLAALCRNTAETVALLRPAPELSVSAPGALLLHADGKLLETMLLNLLSNCLLHAEGLSVIRISLTETERTVILSVSDDGCGIPPDRMHTVFSRYRSSFELGSLSAGSGLGLSVVRGIAARHGGTLLLESREGQGTAVRVSLSRSLGGANLHGASTEDFCNMSSLLTGLAGCLPDDCYGTKYLD